MTNNSIDYITKKHFRSPANIAVTLVAAAIAAGAVWLAVISGMNPAVTVLAAFTALSAVFALIRVFSPGAGCTLLRVSISVIALAGFIAGLESFTLGYLLIRHSGTQEHLNSLLSHSGFTIALAPEITGKRVDTSWFDDAVFVGDSISVGLYNYADDGALGDADFLAKECMGYHSAMWDIDYEYAIHPTYNGVEVRIEDAIQDIGKKKIFILLGMNDICSWGVEESVDAMKDFTDMILEKNPDVQIYIQSATPMVGGKVREDYLNNENIREYNELIKPICEERGFVYLDIASVLSDEYGNLRDDYCSDINGAGFHFNRAGDDAWVEYLKTHVE